MATVAGPWLVWELTHSGVMLGLDALFGSLPILLVGAWGGLIADRFDNCLLQIWTQSAYCAVILALWALVVTDVAQVWMVFVESFLLGIVNAIDMPVRQSFCLEMVGPEDLTNAMSLNTTTFTGTRIVRPVIAGALIGVFGVGPVFLVGGLSYLAVVAALLAMRVSELHPRERVPRGEGQVREGVRYVWRTFDLRLRMPVMLVVFLFACNFVVFMPLMAVRAFHGDAATLGSMLSLFGTGSLTGALLIVSRASRPSIPRMVAIAFAVSPTLPVAWIVLAFLGAACIPFPISGNSILQPASAPEIRGRVVSLYAVVFLDSTPIGGPLAGFV